MPASLPSLPSRHRVRAVVLALAVTALGLCASAPALAQRVGDMEVASAWVRPTVQGQPAAGAYMTLRNHGKVGDRLVAVRMAIAGKSELHSMHMDGDVMRMRQVESVEVPAGRTVKLAPGGLHVMLIGPKQALTTGDKVVATLQFEKAGEVTVHFDVGQGPPSAADGGHGAHKH